MPSQALTYARHKAEKAARKRARFAQNRRDQQARRDATGAQQVNAKAGSRAQRAAAQRLKDQRQKIADARAKREADWQQRHDDALKRQREHDASVRDMLTNLADFNRQQASDDAQAAANQANADAQKGNEPLVTQPPKEKGPLKGRVVGSIDLDSIDTMKDRIATATYYLGTLIDGATGDYLATLTDGILNPILEVQSRLENATKAFRQRLKKT